MITLTDFLILLNNNLKNDTKKVQQWIVWQLWVIQVMRC